MGTDSPHWYSIIALKPDPETAEAVNVAIAFGNGRVEHILYDPELTRAECFVDELDLVMYGHVLNHLHSVRTSLATPAQIETVLGPNFDVSDPVALLREPDAALIQQLREEYVGPRRQEGVATARDVDATLQENGRKEVHRIIGEILTPNLLGRHLRKAPSFDDLITRGLPLPINYPHKFEFAIEGKRRRAAISTLAVSGEPRRVRSADEKAAKIFRMQRDFGEIIRVRKNRNVQVLTAIIAPPSFEPPSKEMIAAYKEMLGPHSKVASSDNGLADAISEAAEWAELQI